MSYLAAVCKPQQERRIGQAGPVGFADHLLRPRLVEGKLPGREAILQEIDEELAPLAAEFDVVVGGDLGQICRDAMRQWILHQRYISVVSQGGAIGKIEAGKLEHSLCGNTV